MKASEYFGKWLLMKRAKLAPTTFASYEDIIARFLVPYFGEMELDMILPMDVELFLGELFEQGYAPGTIRRVYSVLRGAMGKAARMRFISENPTGGEKIDPIQKVRREIPIFTLAQVKELLAALERENLRWRCFGRMALDSGCRRGELVALQWADLSENRCIIRRAAYKLPGKETATKPPKNGQERTIFLSAGTSALLEKLRKEQRRDCLRCGRGWQREYFVFGKDGEMLHPSTPTHWWRKFLEKNALPPRPLHALRHTSATLLLRNGVDIKTVSSRLGHSSLEVTEIYLHLIDDAAEAAAGIMEGIL